MTNEKINIAIAKACKVQSPNVRYDDYCDDLNSMHEAEKILNEEQKEKYFFNLMCVFGNWPKAIQATAKQRAEAFLRTLGKWKESANERRRN